MMRELLVILFLLGSGCQSGEKSTTEMVLPDQDAESQADGGAFTADSMHFRKPMPSNPTWRPMEFYFKKCSLSGNSVYYSKHEYACSGL